MLEKRNNISFLIAGSRPSKQLIDYCAQVPNITLIANPLDVYELYSNSKVLINPTLFGSGVNIKSIEMLFLNKPVVCTSQAIAGLPEAFWNVFHIADSSDKFAAMISSLLDQHPRSVNNSSEELKEYFSLNYFKISVDKMKECCNRKSSFVNGTISDLY